MVPRVALVSCELRAALVRSGQAGAPQRGQGDGRKVVRTGGFDDEGIYTKVLKWNLLEFTRIYFFGGDYTKSQSWAWGGMRISTTVKATVTQYIIYCTQVTYITVYTGRNHTVP